MKKLFTAIFVMVSAMVVAQKNNPLSYSHYIYGNIAIGANGEVYLENVKSKGFQYTYHNHRGYENVVNEKAAFMFEKITTSPSISLSAHPNLQYWRKDFSGNWITDSEGGSGTANDKLEKDITVVIVLDCSASLGDDFQKVKNGAISFLRRIYNASDDGHINLGIVGFSSIEAADKQTFDIRPLTYKSYQDATQFINRLSTEKLTALYYAVNKATDMLENAVPEIVNKNGESNYGGTYMLVFTDGLDNGSQLRDQRLFRSEDVYNYVKRRLETPVVNSSNIETHIIGVLGKDLKPETRQEFRRVQWPYSR